jgi:UDP-3-O-[3-hydroxymyristoyl] N-acetylglucosamine deacetylase/3-hydroxyacyl-[acyl-carrier-protein] dehydratase
MQKQKTIEKEVSVSGIGLHTGNKVNLKFKPAEADSGIVFIRRDIEGSPSIRAVTDNLLPTSRSPRRTSLGKGAIEIHTVEHLMAALAGLEIDNLRIEIDAVEVPGLDGSTSGFVAALDEAGIRQQARPRHFYNIKEIIVTEEEGAMLIALPSNEFKISYTLNYPHPQLKAQFMEVILDSDYFRRELANSRTFCLEDEVKNLQGQGLGKGANFDNTLVVGQAGVIKNKLRFEDEFVRHKILDLIGDLYLLGMPVKAHIIAIRSGHAANLKLLHKIRQQKERYETGGITPGYLPESKEVLTILDIMKILPHRYPFILVDRIISLEKGKRAVGIKNVTINDYFFQGHFPQRPVMPGVLIIEAMAQVGGIIVSSLEGSQGKIAYFMAADNIKFRKPVIPGDTLVLKVEAVKIKSRTGQVKGQAYVGNKLAAEAELMFALVE